MKLHIETIQYHRNGICGAPFHILIFRDPDEGRMVGIVFDQEYHVAVFNLDKLAAGNITFGQNSWRGDRYEPYLRSAIARRDGEPPAPAGEGEPLEGQADQQQPNIHAMLAERKQIAIVWSVEDVQEVRPDLSDEQAWQVLQFVERKHDAEMGINWLTLECASECLFGPNHETDFE